jgi:SAM-dependent methyltransferase
MHPSAYETGKQFIQRFLPCDSVVLEVGSYNVNGTLRDFCPPDCRWIGIDHEPGPGVDKVFQGLTLPFENASVDVVVSTSCLEHDRFFWNTFTEMARVCRPGGYIYINAPSNGAVHRYPVDCWRFYPDAAQALADWSEHCGYPIKVVETEVKKKPMRAPRSSIFSIRSRTDGWLDFHAIYQRAA